jgi:hypothetical protein
MIFINDRNIKSSLKQFGHNSYDSKINEVINKCLYSFVQNENSKKQRGGAETTLPLEYFGVKTGHYFENPPQGTNMAVTDSMIRPALSVVDLQNTIEGGSKKFAVPAISVKRACEAVGKKTTAAQQRVIKSKFENVLQDVIRKASKKNTGDHLSLTSLQAVLEQRQYQKLFKV